MRGIGPELLREPYLSARIGYRRFYSVGLTRCKGANRKLIRSHITGIPSPEVSAIGRSPEPSLYFTQLSWSVGCFKSRNISDSTTTWFT